MRIGSAVRGRWAVVFAVFLASSACIAAPRKNGFPLEPSSVPAREIRRGGHSRAEIPALVHPPSVPADEAPWDDDERVIGVAVGQQARAYPVSMLVRHELVNDLLGCTARIC